MEEERKYKCSPQGDGREHTLPLQGEGIKLDKGKPELASMIIDFKEPLLEMCKTWEYGKNLYGKSNWKKVDNGKDRYTNAMLRHLLAEEDNPYDDESGLPHAAHIAFNALARLYFIICKTKNKTIPLVNGCIYEMPTPVNTGL